LDGKAEVKEEHVRNVRGLEISFAEFVERIAARTGLVVKKHNPSLVIIPFDMGRGRKQNVWVKPIGLDHMGNLIIGFSSPALQMPTGQMLSQETANKLLRQNANLPYGAWAIEKSEGGEFLIVFDTQIAQTMQPQEFEASVRTLAQAADAMEKELGVDVF
jgi:hypothetical protein